MKQASSPLPLDLHVLGLSLAFILSQDQTLRCFILFFTTFQFLLFISARHALTYSSFTLVTLSKITGKDD